MKRATLLPVLFALALGCNTTEENNEESGGESDSDTLDQTMFDAGSEVFAGTCAACHGADGLGGGAPSLADRVPGMAAADVTNTVTNGTGEMPPQNVTGDDLTAVVYFVIESFGE
jgi:mono/diheme cytochrome c family protein